MEEFKEFKTTDDLDDSPNLLEVGFNEIDKFYNLDGPLSKEKEDYIPRESQIESTKKIFEGLMKKNHIIFEGPCGLGKTFTYLTAAGIYAFVMGGEFPRVIVATNGVSLQEQLFYKDAPFIANIFKNHYSVNIKHSLLKGKGNYLCLNKLNKINSQNSGVSEIAFKAQYGAKVSLVYKDYIKFLKTRRDGNTFNSDTSALTFVMDYKEQSEVICTKDKECLGRRCDYYAECLYQKRRSDSKLANLVITNYHMLFIDTKLPSPILSPYDIVIMDEGHEVPDIFRSTTDKRINLRAIENSISEAINIATSYPVIKDAFNSKMARCTVSDDVQDLFRYIKSLHIKDNKEEDIIFASSDIMVFDKDIIEKVSYSMDMFIKICQYLAEHVDEVLSEYRDESEDSSELFKHLSNTTDIINRFKVYKYIIEKHENIFKDSNFVFWLSPKDGDFSMNVRAVNAGAKIYQSFLSRENNSLCILTSATLSTNENFEYIKNQMGFDLVEKNKDREITEIIGESPFNLFEQELWYIPGDAVSASNDSEDFRNSISSKIKEIIELSGGGALCLFTSYRNMNMVYSDIFRDISSMGVNIMKQGDTPRMTLLDNFKNDKDSVLFATRSFFTGVDIPGDSLRCVIIDKLPFPQMNDPVMKKLSEVNGRSSFFKDSLPLMIITLKQAFGRGVRSTKDKCLLVILDSRIRESSYGEDILKSFKYKKKGAKSLDDIKQFFQ